MFRPLRKNEEISASQPGGHQKVMVYLGILLVTASICSVYVFSSAAGPGYALEGFPLDDSWIHLVYARSLAQGEPFQYNPGQWETGSTSPLWAMVLAPGLRLGLPAVGVAKILGIIFLTAAAGVGFRTASRFSSRGAGLVFGLTFPLVPYFSFAAVSGTEVPLFVFLLLLSMELFLWKRWPWAGLAAGLAILARPEGFLFLPLFAGALAVHAAQTSAGRGATVPRSFGTAFRFFLRIALRLILPGAAAVAPWIAFCLGVTGRPFPTTFYAKAEWLGILNLEQMRKIAGLLATQPFLGSSFQATMFAVAGAGLGAFFLFIGWRRIARSSKEGGVLLGLWPFLFLYALSIQLPLGDISTPDVPGSVTNFYYARYLLPAMAPLFLVWSVGFVEAGRWVAVITETRGANRNRLAFWVSLGAFMALPAASALHQHRGLSRTYSWNCQNIETMQVAAGRWIAENLPAGATLGVTDAGAVRYFGERRTVDLVGLNSHRLLPLLKAVRNAPKNSPEQARLRAEFWRQQPLDHVAILGGMHAALLRESRGKILQTFTLETNTICGRPEMIVAAIQPPAAPH